MLKRLIAAVLPLSVVIAVVAAAVAIGSVPITIRDILALVGRDSEGVTSAAAAIILTLRLPRIALAFLVGASLALSGCVLQGLLRNPLADPYIVGASSGASVGAAAAILLIGKCGVSWQQSLWSLGLVPPFAFLGALAAVLVAYRLARNDGQVSVIALLLAGVALSTVLSAILTLLIYIGDEVNHPLIYWLMGSFNNRGWRHVLAVLPYPLVGGCALAAKSSVLDILALGETKAQQLGVDVEKEKFRLLLTAALLTGAAVAVSGVIAFTGLLIPHVLRLIYGPGHRQLLVRSVLWGGCFMIAADTLARTLLRPVEIPVGIVTALCGGPFFLYLLRREQDKYWGESNG